jgi:RNA polymerase sigma factor (sigma-70 family)
MPQFVKSGPHAADIGGVGLSANGFAEIYGEHMPEITRYCRSILRNRDDAEDAAQNAMERALKALSDGPAPERMRPWLFTIAQRESVNVLRRRRAADAELLEETAVAPQGSPEELSAVRERLAELLSDLHALAPRQRECLVARELCGRSYRDIARDLGTSEAAAQQVVLEARQSLRQFEAGRSLECDEVQSWISAHDHARVRTRRVGAHLRSCGCCRGFQQSIRGRRRDFGLLLPGLGSGGTLWGALAALLGQGGAKVVTAGAVVAAGATIVGTVAVPAGSSSRPAPSRVDRAPVAVAVATPLPTPFARGVRVSPVATPAVPRSRAADPEPRRAVAPRVAKPVVSHVPAAVSTAAPTDETAEVRRPARQAPASAPSPETTAPEAPASSPRSSPAEPVRAAVQPVTDAVAPVAETVEKVVEDVVEALPEPPPGKILP